MSTSYNLEVLPNSLAICRLAPTDPFPSWAQAEGLLAIIRTQDELSVVCEEINVPRDGTSERSWRVLKVAGLLDFSMVGVLASLSTTLADAGISIFVLSTT